MNKNQLFVELQKKGIFLDQELDSYGFVESFDRAEDVFPHYEEEGRLHRAWIAKNQDKTISILVWDHGNTWISFMSEAKEEAIKHFLKETDKITDEKWI